MNDKPTLQEVLARLRISKPDAPGNSGKAGKGNRNKKPNCGQCKKAVGDKKALHDTDNRYGQLFFSRVQTPKGGLSQGVSRQDKENRSHQEDKDSPQLDKASQGKETIAKEGDVYLSPATPKLSPFILSSSIHTFSAPSDHSMASPESVWGSSHKPLSFCTQDVELLMDGSPITPNLSELPTKGGTQKGLSKEGSPMVISPEPVNDVTGNCDDLNELQPSAHRKNGSNSRVMQKSLLKQVLGKNTGQHSPELMAVTPAAPSQPGEGSQQMEASSSVPTLSGRQSSGTRNQMSQATRTFLESIHQAGGSIWDSPLVKGQEQQSRALPKPLESQRPWLTPDTARGGTSAAPGVPGRVWQADHAGPGSHLHAAAAAESLLCGQQCDRQEPAAKRPHLARECASAAWNAHLAGGSVIDSNTSCSRPAPTTTSRAASWINQAQVKRSGVRGISTRADAECVFRHFAKQQDAFEYAEACNEAAANHSGEGPIDIVKCWCEEKQGHTGFYRCFIAASYEAFYKRYKDLAAHARHCYEIIREDTPCHLYYDLEFSKLSNPGVSGEALVDKLIDLTADCFKQNWDLVVDRSRIVELDSSTEEKFSRHLIVKVQGYAFESNVEVGGFVNRLATLPQIGFTRGLSLQAASLSVRKANAEGNAAQVVSIVDLAVYSRNRHFRVLWSSKGGKTTVLMPTERSARVSSGGNHQLFLHTLVCNTSSTDKLLTFEHLKLLSCGLIKAPGMGSKKRADGGCTTGFQGGVPVTVKCDNKDRLAEHAMPFETIQALGEKAMATVVAIAMERSGGQHAYIRAIVYCGLGGMVTYNMLGPGSHFCENIGRDHQSNCIYFLLDLAAGMYCQKCYDPDCAHYRSVWRPLPGFVKADVA